MAASPERENRWLDKDGAAEIFGFIKSNSPGAQIHIGGGEPFLNPQRLLDIVETAFNYGICLSYVETNAFWGNNPNKYEPILKELYKLGLRSILISVSPFHAEFIKPQTSINAIKMVRSVFGYAGAFIWIAEFLAILSKHDKAENFDIKTMGAEMVRQAADMYYLIPGGRCGYLQPAVAMKRPARDFFMTSCGRELISTAHFHIDAYGNYMPGGLCGGIAMCDYKRAGDEINLNDRPLLKILYNEGIKGLYEIALKAGYSELSDGYCGKCHLCVDIRNYLFNNAGENEFIELAPAEFYNTITDEINHLLFN